MAKYAKGNRAVGICARSGRKMPLKDLVPDGQNPGLLVDPDWRDIKHETERSPLDLADAEALRRPAPDIDDDSAGAGDTLKNALFPNDNVFGGGT